MFFGSDWLANLYMGCFLFGLIFTSLSLFLNFGHIGGGHAHVTHGAGHSLGQGGHAHAHVSGPQHGGSGHGQVSASEQIESLGPLNLPTLLAFVTWFGGAGYIFRTTLGWDGIVTAILALISGVAGGALVFLVMSYIFLRGQTPPMRRADYYLPGTHARVVSGIGAGGTGEIIFQKGGSRRVEGARCESGVAVPRGTEVVINRYENGLAYVQPIITVSNLPSPLLARVEDATEGNTQPLASNGPAYTKDLRNQL